MFAPPAFDAEAALHPQFTATGATLPELGAGSADLDCSAMDLDDSLRNVLFESTSCSASPTDDELAAFGLTESESGGFFSFADILGGPPLVDPLRGSGKPRPATAGSASSFLEDELAGSGASAPMVSMSDAELADILGLPPVDECLICHDAAPGDHPHFGRCGHGEMLCGGCADKVLECPWCREAKDGVTEEELEAERARLDAHALACNCVSSCPALPAQRAPAVMEARLRQLVASFASAGAAPGVRGRDAAAAHVRSVMAREFGAAALAHHDASLSAILCEVWPAGGEGGPGEQEAKPDAAGAGRRPRGASKRGKPAGGKASSKAGGKAPAQDGSRLPTFSTTPRADLGGLSDYDIFSYDLPDLLALAKARRVEPAKLRAHRKRLQNRAHAKASVDRRHRAKNTLGAENEELRAENRQLREAASSLVGHVQALTLAISAEGRAHAVDVPAALVAALARVTGVLARD